MIARRWIVTCDAPGCHEVLIVPPAHDGLPDGKWDAGMYAEDSEWDVRPGRREAYCTTHDRRAGSDSDV